MKATIEGIEVEGSPQEVLAVIAGMKFRKEVRSAITDNEEKSRVRVFPTPVKRTYVRRKGKKRTWSVQERRAVEVGMRDGVAPKKIARSLGRTYWSIMRMITRIRNGDFGKQASVIESVKSRKKYSVRSKTWKTWSVQDEAYLRSNWFGGRNVAALMSHTGRTESAIRARAYKLGLADAFRFPAKPEDNRVVL